MSDCDRCGLSIWSECKCDVYQQIEDLKKRIQKLEDKILLHKAFYDELIPFTQRQFEILKKICK